MHETQNVDEGTGSTTVAHLLRPWAVAPEVVDLASLAREWVALASGTGEDGDDEVVGASVTSLHQLRLQPIVQFVRSRLVERAAVALAAGDELAHGFIVWELDWIDAAWRDLGDHPHRLAEVEAYLKRSAVRNRRHPTFEVEWRVPGW